MGCKNAALPEPLLENHTINCLTFGKNTRQPYNDNLCLFCVLALHMHGNQRLEEETSKLFNIFVNKTDGPSPNQFQGIHMNDIPTVEDLLSLNILLYDIDFFGWDHCRRTCQTKCAETRKHCATAKIQQPHMLREQHYCSLPIFSLPYLQHFLQQNFQIGTTINYMQ